MSQKSFKSIEEAEYYIKQSSKTMLQKFCPIITCNCRRDCASFREGTVQEITRRDGNEYRATVSECMNLFINSYVFHEGDIGL